MPDVLRTPQARVGAGSACLRMAALTAAMVFLPVGANLAAQQEPAAKAAPVADKANVLVLETRHGRTLIRLRPDLAPRHVQRMKTLARQRFYDGIAFHRVIENFMAQAGDPTGTGRGGSKLPDLPAEFSKERYRRGTVGMARRPDPDTGNSQFFICYTEEKCRKNNGRYTIFGEVISGMEAIDRLKKGPLSRDGMVTDPDRIIRIYLASEPPK